MQAHSLASCPLPGPARLNLAALGDFPITNGTSESLSIDAAGTTLGFPASTAAVEATANADLAPQAFIGYTERLSERFDFLLWPQGVACELFRPDSSGAFPGMLGGEALGFSRSTGLVMLAGSNDSSSAAIVGALTFDTRSGQSYVVDPRKRDVLSEPRAFATVTDFDGKVLVAGGENPIHDSSQPSAVLRDSAEVYDPVSQSFEPELVTLAEAITRHAAVTLDNGETALIGGRDEASDASRVVQVVSPFTRISKLVDSLDFGRNAASALRLSDGRILVGGGSNADGHPVGALEWRDTDASKLSAPVAGSVMLPPRFDRAFTALPGGAALAVGGCEDRAPAPGEDCAAWCAHGCPPTPDSATSRSYDAFWISTDGLVTALDFPWSAPQPVLVQGSDGRPWLIASDVDQSNQPLPGSFALYRFDPWQKRFDAVDRDLGFGQSLNQARLVGIGPDAFVWLGADAGGPFLRGVRLGTRSALSSDVPLVGLRDGAARPAHLVPDHVPDANVSYELGALSFFPLPEGSTPTCVWVADAEYGDFSAQIGFSTATPPALRLGGYQIVDPSASNQSSRCALPSSLTEGAGSQGATCLDNPQNCLDLQRKGAQLTMSMGAARSRCTLDPTSALARLPFAVCQSEFGSATVTQIAITRGD